MPEETIKCPRCGRSFIQKWLFDCNVGIKAVGCPCCGARLKKYRTGWKWRLKSKCIRCNVEKYVYVTKHPEQNTCDECGAMGTMFLTPTKLEK